MSITTFTCLRDVVLELIQQVEENGSELTNLLNQIKEDKIYLEKYNTYEEFLKEEQIDYKYIQKLFKIKNVKKVKYPTDNTYRFKRTNWFDTTFHNWIVVHALKINSNLIFYKLFTNYLFPGNLKLSLTSTGINSPETYDYLYRVFKNIDIGPNNYNNTKGNKSNMRIQQAILITKQIPTIIISNEFNNQIPYYIKYDNNNNSIKYNFKQNLKLNKLILEYYIENTNVQIVIMNNFLSNNEEMEFMSEVKQKKWEQVVFTGKKQNIS